MFYKFIRRPFFSSFFQMKEKNGRISRSFLFDPSPSLSLSRFLICHRVIFPLERIDNTRLQHTWNTKLLLLVVDTRRRHALQKIASLISSSPPPPVRGLIIFGRRVICWSRGRNNNAGNVSPKNRWGIRENAVA